MRFSPFRLVSGAFDLIDVAFESLFLLIWGLIGSIWNQLENSIWIVILLLLTLWNEPFRENARQLAHAAAEFFRLLV